MFIINKIYKIHEINNVIYMLIYKKYSKLYISTYILYIGIIGILHSNFNRI